MSPRHPPMPVGLTFDTALVTDAGPYSPSNETVIESLFGYSNYADASV